MYILCLALISGKFGAKNLFYVDYLLHYLTNTPYYNATFVT